MFSHLVVIESVPLAIGWLGCEILRIFPFMGPLESLFYHGQELLIVNWTVEPGAFGKGLLGVLMVSTSDIIILVGKGHH